MTLSNKKKIIIVNNNLDIGGVQKSLISLLKEISNLYDISLLLFSKTGDYIKEIPDNVSVIECHSLYKYLGISQGQCISKRDYFLRGALAFMTRIFGRKNILKIISLSQEKLKEKYDCAISFLHNGPNKLFYGGCNEFVLEKTNADIKVGFIHCDYSSCGADCKANNESYFKFDKIAACSEGCQAAFLSCLPELSQKTVVVHNCHNFEKINALAIEEKKKYDERLLNILTVARLSGTKGIDRGIIAISEAIKKNKKIMYHIIGDGIERQNLKELCKKLEIEKNVVFYGNQSNPYKYMTGADLFLLSSYHEAAPLVIEEARSLGLPVLTTATTSSEDMVEKTGCGWVCENSQQGLTEALTQLILDKKILTSKKEELKNVKVSNTQAVKEFCSLMKGN